MIVSPPSYAKRLTTLAAMAARQKSYGSSAAVFWADTAAKCSVSQRVLSFCVNTEIDGNGWEKQSSKYQIAKYDWNWTDRSQCPCPTFHELELVMGVKNHSLEALTTCFIWSSWFPVETDFFFLFINAQKKDESFRYSKRTKAERLRFARAVSRNGEGMITRRFSKFCVGKSSGHPG